MKLAIGILATFLAFAEFAEAQTDGTSSNTEALAPVPKVVTESYTVFGATPFQEAALRAQIRLMHPEILPLRVFFVPHWKYLDNARIFRLHVPTGYGSLMFTHLPSRTVFIDNDQYQGEEWLGYWMAHELGHLKTNSAKESDAERAAREFRKRLSGIVDGAACAECSIKRFEGQQRRTISAPTTTPCIDSLSGRPTWRENYSISNIIITGIERTPDAKGTRR